MDRDPGPADEHGDGETDAALWAAALGGDGAAFGVLFDRHRDRVFRHAYRLVVDRPQAEDVLAAAFLELWRRRASVRLVDGSPLPWLLVTASNVARNVRRGTRRHRRLLDALPRAGDVPAAEESAFVDDPAEVVDPVLGAALRALPAADLRLLTLVALEGWSLSDAAELLGLTPSAAKSRLHRARVRLRAAVGAAEPGRARLRPNGAFVEGGRS
ncbi:RNA polymerase sigma factor [Cellulosimicrobium cellulans]|uniref:RNA polymerase sigma factor n=1 Tax=Cellulosimicrobium cellulans TaxID=1710 RepID=UPI00364DDAD6